MKIKAFSPENLYWFSAVAVAALFAGVTTPGLAADEPTTQTIRVLTKALTSAEASPQIERVLIQKVETDQPGSQDQREVPWLGVSIEETSEALAAQLGLNPGEGLIVTYVAPESPAAKADLEKNDVLAKLDDQLLVHPAQLRKLIQMHKAGDTVQIVYYRAAKKHTVRVTLAKASHRLSPLGEGGSWQGELHELQRQLRDMKLGEAARENLSGLRQSLEIEKEHVSKDVKRSMEEVRKALQEAMRQVTNAHRTFGPAAREFQELARRGLDVDKDATVVVKSQRNSVQTVVKTDDSGTYVVIADPAKRLTAHDKSGKLLFDGPIQTPDQQAKVPEEVWVKVKPMLKQLGDEKPAEPAPEEDPDAR